MGQKVNPTGFRVGVIRGWESNWYGGKDFSDKLVEDDKIREYIKLRIENSSNDRRNNRDKNKNRGRNQKNAAGISKVIIERTLKRITLTIHTARPGVVIGKGGDTVDKLKEELKQLTNKDVQINIAEIRRPEADAKLVADSIAQQLQARISYRRAMKQAISAAKRANVQGIKIKVSGRLGGAEMARSEQYKEGRIPLHTIRADIDYAISEANTTYGIIGVKVWIFKKEIYGKPDLLPDTGSSNNEKGQRRRGGGRRRKR